MITAAMVKELREATSAGLLDCKKALEASDGNFDQAAAFLREKGLDKAAQKADRETKAGLVVVKAQDGNACAVEVDCETDFVAHTDEFTSFVHRLADQVLGDPNLTDADSLLAVDFIDTPGKTVAAFVQQLIGRLGENMVVRRVAHYFSSATSVVESYVHAGALDGFYGASEGRVGVLVELGASDPAAKDALRELAHDLALHIASTNPVYVAPDDIPGDVLAKTRADIEAELAGENKPEHIRARIVEGRMNKFYQAACLLRQTFVKDDSLTIEALLQQRSAEIGAVVTVNRFVCFDTLQ